MPNHISPEPGSRKRVTSFVLGLVAFLLAGFFAARHLATWPARIGYPGEESYEGCALVETARLAQGIPIYAPPGPQGFAGATYGPLYYLLGSRLIDPNNPSYFPLRLLSAFAILGCAAGCGMLAFWLTKSYLAAGLSPLVFLAYGIVTFHGVSALSDNVALFLFFSGFLVAYRFRDSRAVSFAVPLITLGFYYKQQFIAGTLAVMVYLLLERRYVRLAEFAGLLAASGIAMFALFQWVVFPGQEFWRHFLFYQTTLFSWHQFRSGLFNFAFMFGAAVLLGFEYLRRHPDRMIRYYLICAVLLGLLTNGKETAFIQYFYESILLISVLMPALLASRLAARRGVVEVLALMAIALFLGQWYTPPPPVPGDVARYNAVQDFFRHSFPPGSRALGFRAGDLVQAGLDTPFADVFQTELLARRGVVPDRELLARIRERWFSVIVLDFDLEKERDPQWLDMYLTPLARDTIEQNYQLVDTIEIPVPERVNPRDQFYIYVPQPGRLDRQAAIASADPEPFMFAAPVLLRFKYLRSYPNRMNRCYLTCPVPLGLLIDRDDGVASAFVGRKRLRSVAADEVRQCGSQRRNRRAQCRGGPWHQERC